MKKARKVLVVIVIMNIYLSLVSWSNITSATMETEFHTAIALLLSLKPG